MTTAGEVTRAVPKMLFSVNDLVAATSYGRTFIYEQIAAGKLKSIGSGKQRRVRHEDLLAWIGAMEAA